ncbi:MULTISPECIES: hypothetical protein [Bacillaceae]|uniref:hypothetical protein n=1 Tax=Bacillaceae TaxID=186817 RepID=UPI002FFDEAD2
MSELKWKLEALRNDLNQEESHIIKWFERITDTMFSMIKWAGIPFVIYLLVEIIRW